MQIVVLDGYTLNPGDLSWAPLEALAPCTIYDRTPQSDTIARAKDAEILLTNKTILSREILLQLPKLRYVGVLATGYNVVDLDFTRQRNIPVTNVPGYATPSVVQMVFAHLMNLTLRVADHGRSVAAGRWTQNKDFCYWDYPLVELSGLTMGIVGFGQIGRAVASAAQAFGMNVLVYEPRDCPNFRTHHGEAVVGENGTVPFTASQERTAAVRFVGLEELFRSSDVVSLHCPLTSETKHLVNADRLALMKPSAYLLNTGRGPLVDEPALAEALNSGLISGAGLDVLSIEPPPAENPLLTAKNCFISPHIAWATRAARQRLLSIAVANVHAFLSGRPLNVVNA
jgi:glycerate dehydrogenase